MLDGGFPPILLFAAALIAVFVAIAIFAWRRERQRRDAIAQLAGRLGLSFAPDHDRALAREYENIRGLRDGENRYAFNALSGAYRGRPVTTLDFHYETSSTDSEGKSQTDHHHLHVVVLHLDRAFPHLLIAPENVFSKIAQAFGYDDIDFESHEFSRRFCVRSPDKRFAYDFCNSAMIEFLLANPSLRFEVQDRMLALVFDGLMKPALIEPRLDLACALRERMPEYLFAAQ